MPVGAALGRGRDGLGIPAQMPAAPRAMLAAHVVQCRARTAPPLSVGAALGRDGVGIGIPAQMPAAPCAMLAAHVVQCRARTAPPLSVGAALGRDGVGIGIPAQMPAAPCAMLAAHVVQCRAHGALVFRRSDAWPRPEWASAFGTNADRAPRDVGRTCRACWSRTAPPLSVGAALGRDRGGHAAEAVAAPCSHGRC